MADINTDKEKESHRKAMALRLEQRFMRVFNKVYMRDIDFAPLSIETLRAMEYLIKDVETLEIERNKFKKFRPY